MKIQDVEFAGAIATPGAAPPGSLPQVAFSGRSNVGKSSLINRLLGRTRSKVARVSGTPGKTQEINFYRVRTAPGSGAGEFYLVDLPGYGYARVPSAKRDAWRPLIESYLERTGQIRGVVQLIDARHPPTADDRRMVAFLGSIERPALFVLTKMDKLKHSEREARVRDTIAALDVDAEQVVPFSAVTGEGREDLLQALDALLGGGG